MPRRGLLEPRLAKRRVQEAVNKGKTPKDRDKVYMLNNGMAQEYSDIVTAGPQHLQKRRKNNDGGAVSVPVLSGSAGVPIPSGGSAAVPVPPTSNVMQLAPGTQVLYAIQMAQGLDFMETEEPVPVHHDAGPYDGFYPIGTMKDDPVPHRMVWARLGEGFKMELRPGNTDFKGNAISRLEDYNKVWETAYVKVATQLSQVTKRVKLVRQYETKTFAELKSRLYDTMAKHGEMDAWPWRNGNDFVENQELEMLTEKLDDLYLLHTVPDDMTLLDVVNGHEILAKQIETSFSNAKNAMNTLESDLKDAQNPYEFEQAYAQIRERIVTELKTQLEAFIPYRKTSDSTKFTTPFAWEKRWEMIAGVQLASHGFGGQASPSQAHDPILKGFSAIATIKEIRERFGGQTDEDEIGEEDDGEDIKIEENNSGTIELD